MKRQRGQSMVEFALMAPIVFMMIFGMIWGGIMFMQYMHYSNAVRTAAREIAVSVNDTNKDDTITAKEDWLRELWRKEVAVKFYEPDPKITIKNVTAADGTVTRDKVVIVIVYFKMEENAYNSLPNILKNLQFPPRSIKALNYRMKLEGKIT